MVTGGAPGEESAGASAGAAAGMDPSIGGMGTTTLALWAASGAAAGESTASSAVWIAKSGSDLRLQHVMGSVRRWVYLIFKLV